MVSDIFLCIKNRVYYDFYYSGPNSDLFGSYDEDHSEVPPEVYSVSTDSKSIGPLKQSE